VEELFQDILCSEKTDIVKLEIIQTREERVFDLIAQAKEEKAL